MCFTLLGALGFLSFALKELADYDEKLFKRISKNSVIRSGALHYIGGMAMIAIGTVMQIGKVKSIGFCVAAAVFLILQLYALFGCFPSKKAYGSGEKQTVFDKGVYAMCRHPGLLFFTGTYVCLSLGTEHPWSASILYIILDLILVTLEDKVFFPKTIEAYADYKRTTPFLIPTPKSIKRMFK